ncbi:MAG: biotin--[acetyl-CoA-carboxylase] ligase [Bacteroidaceae bacterium]|nr:biotin--[acetyl-CoA-carboxylase] ligase [Bacteroidaceae bacterium]
MNDLIGNIEFFHVAETDSTNNLAATLFAERKAAEGEMGGMIIVSTDYQTAGRGQRGAKWESERGSNLLFSVAFRPKEIKICRQFRLSQAMAVAVCDALCDVKEGFEIKWPNDIYFGLKKISGTIIETSWRGDMVDRCVMGVGVNVNQCDFVGDAPNPISLVNITGGINRIEDLLRNILDRFVEELSLLYSKGEEELAARYGARMMWRDGVHKYCDANGFFEAFVEGVEADGHLLLRDMEGVLRKYMFKEVKHVILNT